ncbi:hypothetical protein Gohar_004455 [Gossypium harknessii]|uniref:RNase H type-1 domain-containing protein n=1 Tax=Gossypium harknessii TaxID=34285 RepID=A0A7J9H503_9ROSI|nr:hypothetical protein [Gossypium harknessii]
MMSFGLVARDHDGFVLEGRAGVLEINTGAEWAELQALAESMELAREKRWLKLELESDCANLTSRCYNKAADQLCKWAYKNNYTKAFDMDYLVEIHDVILRDAIN